jgi:hypothetical protein
MVRPGFLTMPSGLGQAAYLAISSCVSCTPALLHDLGGGFGVIVQMRLFSMVVPWEVSWH